MVSAIQNAEPPRTTARQVSVILAALMAAAMTTYYERVFQMSLPDINGVWGLSNDEGAVLKTCAVAPQMLLAPVAPWLVTVFGVRPVLLPAALLFIVVSFITPFITGFIPLVAAHIIISLLLGCFITATLMIIFKTLPAKWWLIPLGIHIFRFSLTLNTGVSLSGLYMEYLGWQWVYWQSTAIMVMYFAVLFLFVPKENTQAELMKKADVPGMILLSLSSTMLFVAIDQGERLQWLHSGFITAFMGGGLVLLVLFIFHELFTPHPFAPLRPLADSGVTFLFVQAILGSVALAGNQILITQFLSKIHALKPWQSGQALLVVAGVQLFFIPFVIWLNRNVDARLILAIGMLCLATGCYQGTLITSDWMAGDFIPMAICFAFGTPLSVLTLLLYCFSVFGKRSFGLVPYFQCVRVLIPYSIMGLFSAFIRGKTDYYMNSLSQYITPDTRIVQQFIDTLGVSGNNALVSLTEKARLEASVLAFQDAFYICFWAAVLGSCLLVITKPAPYTPLTPVKVGGVVTA